MIRTSRIQEQTGDGEDADGGDHEEVVGGRADDSSGSEFASREAFLYDFDARKQDFRRTRAERHERQV